jgi:hypothetical protein
VIVFHVDLSIKDTIIPADLFKWGQDFTIQLILGNINIRHRQRNRVKGKNNYVLLCLWLFLKLWFCLIQIDDMEFPLLFVLILDY